MLRVRFAPSPTGFLHIGGARTFIFNWLYARSKGGQIVLRIDDTDVGRNTDESLRSIMEGLEWIELGWDEKHHQSERGPLHREAVEALLAKNAAYRDFTPPRPEEERAEGDTSGPWLCNSEMRELPRGESDRRAAAGEPFVVRFRTPREAGGGVKFKDLVFKSQFRKIEDLEDFALLRSDGSPTYHMASTVDDVDLKITHIIRGQDHLTNTFKHVLLFQALGAEPPEFAHLPLLLGPDGSKLSKRKHGPVVSVTTYRDRGFLPHAFVNFLCLLGWSPKDNREVMSRQELLDAFSLEGINRVNALVTFDENSEENWTDPKALWLNSQHLRLLAKQAKEGAQPEKSKFLGLVQKELRSTNLWKPDFAEKQEWVLGTATTIAERYSTLTDFSVRGRAYFDDVFDPEPRASENLDKDNVRELLRELAERLAANPDFTEESVERELRSLAEERGVKPGLLINGSRAALTGQSVGPSAFQVFRWIGREKSIQRLRNV